MPVTTKGIKQE